MSLFRPERRSVGSLAEVLAAERVRRSGGGHGAVSDVDQALRLGAVWSCMDLISRLSALPVKQYRRAAGVPVEVERPSPLLSAPWLHMHAIGWRRQVLMSWLTAGNVFGLVAARDRLGYPVQMEILSPSRMSARPVGVGSVQWLLDGRPVGDDLVHWPAFTVPGSPIGLSPLQYAASMTGLGLSAGEFGRRWFSDGAHPSAVLSTDQPVTQDQAATIKERFRAAVSGREPVVLGLGVTYEAIQVSPEESQFLETIKANKADIAGFFLVPPEMIGGESGNSQTYANVEQRSLNYLTYNGVGG
ncbi:MAG: phage portal protein [Microthrixaceae bacterium]|nr:phage portal protein [Microthrixaceae bacterium]